MRIVTHEAFSVDADIQHMAEIRKHLGSAEFWKLITTTFSDGFAERLNEILDTITKKHEEPRHREGDPALG